MEFTGERFIPEKSSESELFNEHYNRYQFIAPFLKGLKVLDAACGAGYGSQIIADYANLVIGIDVDNETVQYASKKYSKKNIGFQQASIAKLPFEDEYFDAVISFETIEHVDTELQNAFLQEVSRVLKPGGDLIISTPDKLIYSDTADFHNEFHVKEFYADEFMSFLENYFSKINFLYQRKEVCEVINSSNKDNLKILRKSNEDSKSGKYIIAFCNNQTSQVYKNVKGSVFIYTDEYESRIKRVMELQYEVHEKNKWAFSLNAEIDKLRNIYSENTQKIQHLNAEINKLQKTYSQNSQKIKSLNESLLKEKAENESLQRSNIEINRL